MPTGVISTLTDRGFGFIQPYSRGRADVFFHSAELDGVAFDDLRCADEVTFELVIGKKGLEARDVARPSGPPEFTDHHESTSKPSAVVIEALQECNEELAEYVIKNPTSLRVVHPGTFENIVAAIFRHEGCTVEHISGWNEPDGGVDLIAIQHLSPGLDIRLAVQCKRWNQSRKLSAEPIRSLEGVLNRFQAHGGVVATTGFFTEEAEEERRKHLWRISLRDYAHILESLRRLRIV